MLSLCMKLLETDNEENAVICLRIIFDLHKNFRPTLEREIRAALDMSAAEAGVLYQETDSSPVFLEDLLKFLPPAVTGDRIYMAIVDRMLHLGQGFPSDLEAQPLLVAHGPQHPGRVVGETAGMERGYGLAGQSFQPSVGVDDLGRISGQG